MAVFVGARLIPVDHYLVALSLTGNRQREGLAPVEGHSTRALLLSPLVLQLAVAYH